ncbi:hypothetical protein MON38_10620 [Hymenobacter sp. DH14]|uniref:Terminase small subunit n=1 Tax=Hymenobacter cyanobacteriorum TaxID=2926463 RepID=A0A9X1VEW0_9BACT|nr:hypothetical protein [Hymenobacter cyanobacteriorum]MCI1187874.1 hypothetical protein [Hymenobacter cyanobacteriorum]
MSTSTLVYTSTPAPEWPPLPTWRAAFLGALALNGNVSDAAKAAGISRDTAYKAKARNPDFAQDFQTAERIASDVLLREAWRRAVEGGRTYKFTKDGDPILHPETGEPYYEMVYSDALLTLLLKARLPEQFGDKLRVEQTIKQEAAYDLNLLTPDEKQALLAMKRRLQTLPATTSDEEGSYHD